MAKAERRLEHEKRETDRIFLVQLYQEVRQVFTVAEWCLHLQSQVNEGAIPSTYQPPFKMALDDLSLLTTSIYDVHGRLLLAMDSTVAGPVMGHYAGIKKRLGYIHRLLNTRHRECYDNFNALAGVIQALRNDAFVVLSDLRHHLGFSREGLEAGPEPYTTFAVAE